MAGSNDLMGAWIFAAACRVRGKLKSFWLQPRDFQPLMQIDLLLVSVLRVLVEVAGFALLGQGILALLAGKTGTRTCSTRSWKPSPGRW
jgi:hypothetical protein